MPREIFVTSVTCKTITGMYESFELNALAHEAAMITPNFYESINKTAAECCFYCNMDHSPMICPRRSCGHCGRFGHCSYICNDADLAVPNPYYTATDVDGEIQALIEAEGYARLHLSADEHEALLVKLYGDCGTEIIGYYETLKVIVAENNEKPIDPNIWDTSEGMFDFSTHEQKRKDMWGDKQNSNTPMSNTPENTTPENTEQNSNTPMSNTPENTTPENSIALISIAH